MDPQLVSIAELIIAVVAAIIAYWQAKQKKVQEEKTAEVIAFFDPQDETVVTPPASVPARSWKMSEETKRWITFDHPAGEREDLLGQIAIAEAGQDMNYVISVPSAWYEIEYGLVKGSGKPGERLLPRNF